MMGILSKSLEVWNLHPSTEFILHLWLCFPTSLTQTSPQGSGVFEEDGVGRVKDQMVVDHFKGIVFSRYSGADELMAVVTECT